MGKNLALLAVLLAVVLGPILMRPRGDEAMLKGQDTLSVITPHNEAIRSEFSEAFREWAPREDGPHRRRGMVHARRHQREHAVSEQRIQRGIRGALERRAWKKWDDDAKEGCLDPRTIPADSPAADTQRQAARRAFLASNVGAKIDVFFGGGSFDFIKMASLGLLVDCGYIAAHPEVFGVEKSIPPVLGGEPYYDEKGRWLGTTLGAFGIAYNRDQLTRLGLPEPHEWGDLADPRYFRSLAIANPVQSGSANKALEMLVQQQMNIVAAESGANEARITHEGWARAMRLLQRIGANARYFTDSSSKIALDVEAGEAAAGMTIDFYGRFQSETVRRADGSSRIGYTDAKGGTSYGTDPIALLRGAPHPELGKSSSNSS